MTESERRGTKAQRLELLANKAKSGDPAANREMEIFIYRELYRLASTYMQRERPNHTLAITGLVHETVTRIVGSEKFADQHHFYATAARIMRNVLVDHAKARRAAKRGGGTPDAPILSDDVFSLGTDGGIDVVEIDELLERLTEHSPENAQAFELHYFAGLSLADTAELLGRSISTVKRQLHFAKAWLMTQVDYKPSRRREGRAPNRS